MDGRGRWLDNVFIERLWRSLRPHQGLGGRAPMTVWRAAMTSLLPENAADMTLEPSAASLTTRSRSPHAHRRHRSRSSMLLETEQTDNARPT